MGWRRESRWLAHTHASLNIFLLLCTQAGPGFEVQSAGPVGAEGEGGRQSAFVQLQSCYQALKLFFVSEIITHREQCIKHVYTVLCLT